MRKQFSKEEKLKYVKLALTKDLETARIQFLIDYEDRYEETWIKATTKTKRKSRNPAIIAYQRIWLWNKSYNLYGEKGLVSMTGKAKKPNNGRKKRATINDLSEHDRAFYQDVMEEILEDHGINRSIIIDKIKERKDKEKSELNNKSKSAQVFNINRTSIYSKYKPVDKQKIAPVERLWVDGLIEWIYIEISKSDNVVGRDKLYNKYKDTVNNSISSYVFRVHFQAIGYKSSAYTRSKHGKPCEQKHKGVWAEDQLKGNFKSTYFGEVLHADISYIKIKGKWWYLHVIIETYSDSIVAFSLSKTRSAEDTIQLTEQAIAKIGYAPRIFHSDHGVEYANYKFKSFLENQGIIQSMSPKGYALGNRPAEYIFALIKREKLNLYNLSDLSDLSEEEVLMLIVEYIDYYHLDRVQSNLQYKTPFAFK